MSNQLGSIYATTKSAKKYIMLDSENVEVSGNFFINGTNSRMPAEIENSLRDYLPLTYGISDPNPTTLYDQFADLSENVLKQRKDASFNNVDISGNLSGVYATLSDRLDVSGDVSFNSNVDITGIARINNAIISDNSNQFILYNKNVDIGNSYAIKQEKSGKTTINTASETIMSFRVNDDPNQEIKFNGEALIMQDKDISNVDNLSGNYASFNNVTAPTFNGDLSGTVSSLSNHTTDDLSEGSTNKYFSTSLVNSHLSGGTGVTYSNGAIAIGQAVGTNNNVTFNQVKAKEATIGEVTSNYVGFASYDNFNVYDYALKQKNDAVGHTMLNAPTGASVFIRNNNVSKMTINSDGVGIGGVPVQNKPLQVYGKIYSDDGFNGGGGEAAWFGTTYVTNIQPIPFGNYNVVYDIGTSGAQYRYGYAFLWISSSDDRLKDNETDISGALETIMKLKPQTYDFKTSEEPDAKHLGLRSGFIAQDVLKIPELAHAVNVPETETEKVGKEVDENGNIVDSDKEVPTYMSLDYNTIFTHAVKAIQELNEKVKSLENEINILKNSSG